MRGPKVPSAPLTTQNITGHLPHTCPPAKPVQIEAVLRARPTRAGGARVGRVGSPPLVTRARARPPAKQAMRTISAVANIAGAPCPPRGRLRPFIPLIFSPLTLAFISPISPIASPTFFSARMSNVRDAYSQSTRATRLPLWPRLACLAACPALVGPITASPCWSTQSKRAP